MKEQVNSVQVRRLILYVKKADKISDSMVRFVAEVRDQVGNGVSVSGEEVIAKKIRLSNLLSTIQTKYLSAA